MSTITPVAGNFVGGQWILPTNPTGVISPIDPGKLERGALHEYPWSVDLAEQAVQAAREAQPAWAALGADGRAEPRYGAEHLGEPPCSGSSVAP